MIQDCNDNKNIEVKFIKKRLKAPHKLSDEMKGPHGEYSTSIKKIVEEYLYTDPFHSQFVKNVEENIYGYYQYKLPYISISKAYIAPNAVVFNSHKEVVRESLNTYYDFDDTIVHLATYSNSTVLYKYSHKFLRKLHLILQRSSRARILYTLLRKIQSISQTKVYIPVLSTLFLNKENKLFRQKEKIDFNNFSKDQFNKFLVRELNINQEIVFCFDHYYSNFTHFLLEQFPRLHSFLHSIPETKKSQYMYLIPPLEYKGKELSVIKECLDALDIKEGQRIYMRSNEILSVNKLLLLRHCKFAPIVPEAINWLIKHYKINERNYYKDSNKLNKYKACKRFFFKRNPDDIRQISNFIEFSSFLKKYDFKEVVIGELSLIEKINLLQNAEIVISTFGSEVTNTIFVPKNCKLIQLSFIDSPLYARFFNTIFNLEVLYQICKPIFKHEHHWYMSNFHVDIIKLEKNIEVLINEKYDTDHTKL